MAEFNFDTEDAKKISVHEGEIYRILSELNAPFDDPNFLFGLVALGYHSALVGGIPSGAIDSFISGLKKIQTDIEEEGGSGVPKPGKGN